MPALGKILAVPTSVGGILLYDFLNPSEAGDPYLDTLRIPCPTDGETPHQIPKPWELPAPGYPRIVAYTTR